MLKAIGLVMIFFGCIQTGIGLEVRLKNQWKLLGEWKEILRYLEKEMTWHRTTLPEALQYGAAGHQGSLGRLLERAAAEMQKREGGSFEQVWTTVLNETISENELCLEKRYLLEEAAAAFCAQDTVMQKTFLEKSIWHLEDAVKEAEREYLEKGRLYRRLSVAMGMFLIILLL